jgi:hypothetical protein
MLTKRDEFGVVSQFLKGDKAVKAFLFDDMIGLITSLLSELKGVLSNGTKEEKLRILKKIKLLRHVMQLHYQSLRAKSKISDEELHLILEHFVARSPLYREKISKAKQELDAHKEELSKFVNYKKSKIKSIKTKSKWIRS